MNNNPNRPRDYDAVLGGQTPPPVQGAVLGGIEGVKRRLASPTVEARIAALSEALNYGEAGLDLVIEALQDSSLQVQRSAFLILRERLNNKVRQALLDYDPWQFFTTLDNWKQIQFNPQIGIADPTGSAYVIELQPDCTQHKLFELEKFKALLKDPKVHQIEALICKGWHGWYSQNQEKGLSRSITALVDACDKLTSLKALFIGDDVEREYMKSRLPLGDITPILCAYPELEVLQMRGDFSENYEGLNFGAIRHDCLKTLTIQTANLDNPTITQITSLALPALEYLELWFGRDYNQTPDGILDSLKPIIFDDSFPNLTYLGLRSSDYSDAIAAALVQSPVIEHLAVLDLSMGNLTDEGAEALLNCSAVNQLHTLNIANNCVSSEMIEQLFELGCWVIADSQEELIERGRASRYYALYE